MADYYFFRASIQSLALLLTHPLTDTRASGDAQVRADGCYNLQRAGLTAHGGSKLPRLRRDLQARCSGLPGGICSAFWRRL